MPVTVITPAESFDLTKKALVKTELEITDASQDDFIDQLIKFASSTIASFTHRVWPVEVITETVAAFGTVHLILSRAPIRTIASVKFRGEPIDSTEFSIHNVEAGVLFKSTGWISTEVFRQGITFIVRPGQEIDDWEVAYTAGYDLSSFATPSEPLLPGAVEKACIELVKEWFFTRRKQPSLESESVSGFWSANYAITTMPEGIKDLLLPYVRDTFTEY